MEENSPGDSHWPPTGVLLACALVLVAGYAAAVWRGPVPAQELRIVTMPAPTPAAEPAAAVE